MKPIEPDYGIMYKDLLTRYNVLVKHMEAEKDQTGNRVVGEDFITHIKGDIFAYDMKSAQYGILLVLNALEKEKKILLSETLRKRIKDAEIGV
jgi:hypothetical protein